MGERRRRWRFKANATSTGNLTALLFVVLRASLIPFSPTTALDAVVNREPGSTRLARTAAPLKSGTVVRI